MKYEAKFDIRCWEFGRYMLEIKAICVDSMKYHVPSLHKRNIIRLEHY